MFRQDPALSASSIIEALNAGIYVLDGDLRVRWVRGCSTFWPEAAAHGEGGEETCHRLFLGREGPCPECPALRALRTGNAEHGEIVVERNGLQLYFALTAAPLRRQDQGRVFIAQMVRDITENRKVENELRRMNDLNMAIVENAPIAVATTDKDGVFTSINPMMAAHIGLEAEEAKRKLIGRFQWLQNPFTIKSGLAENLERGLRGEAFSLKEFPYLTYKGDRKVFIDLQGIPMRGKDGRVNGLLIISENATERVKMREQLMQEAKTAAMAKLAMGIAHGINNPLATIALHSDLASDLAGRLRLHHEAAEELEDLRSYLEVIQEETFRCKKIVNSLLKFTNSTNLDSEEIDVRKLFDELLGLAQFNKSNVTVTKRVSLRLPRIKGNLSAVRQVFWNLLMNAFDAVEDKRAGRIQVKAGVLSDNFLFVDVQDNGRGMSEENKEKIFAAFFTTKMPDKGTGLGLTFSEELAKKMGGTLELHSTEEGKGSTFRVTLPVAERG